MDQIEDFADVYYHGTRAAVLWKQNAMYHFQYIEDFLESENAAAIAYTLPLRHTPYSSHRLFPFFEGLVAEGWLLAGQAQAQRIDKADTFRLLIENGSDLVGAVTVLKRATR